MYASKVDKELEVREKCEGRFLFEAVWFISELSDVREESLCEL